MACPPAEHRDDHAPRAETLSLEIPNARQRVYSPGTVVIHQGDAVTTSRLVKTGWMYSAVELANGSRQIVDIFLPGDFIEPMTMDGGSHVSLCAVDYVTATEFRHDEFIGSSTARTLMFAAEIARLRAIRLERVVSLGRRDAIRRTAHLLLELGERLASDRMAVDLAYPCPMTQTDLADSLGMTAIHVNRTLRDLREMKVLVFKSGSVTVFNRKRVAEFAGFNPAYLQRPKWSSIAD